MCENGTKKKAEYLSGGVFDCLYDEYFTLINSQEGLYEFLGYTREEMDQQFHNHLWECIYREDRLSLKEEIERQISSGKVFMYENRLITKSGEVRWIWISAELRRDARQRRYFHCIFHDITVMKKDQEKLALSEKRYELVLAQMQDIIFELDCRTFEIYYSANFEKKFGYQLPVKGFPDSLFHTDIIFESDKAELRLKFQSLLKGENQIYHEYRLRHRDGYYLWVDVHATAMRDSGGNLLKILGIITDINKRKTEILETRKIAALDSLTGLLNRRECVRRISSYMEEDNSLAALLILDLDHFKTLNDTRGHLYGDSVLSGISEKLLTVFRRGDVIARIGGDEFVIFMPRLKEKKNVIPKLDDILRLLRESVPGGQEPPVSCSIGVSYYPEHGTDFTTLFAKADRAMYQAKKLGRGQYCIYGTRESPVRRLTFEEPLQSYENMFHNQITDNLFRIFLDHQDSHTTFPALLEFIGRVFRADRIYLCQKTGEEPYKNIYNWCSAGTPSMADSLEELCSLDWKITQGFPAASFPDTATIEDPRLKSWFEKRGAKAAFLFCLGDPGNLINIIGLEDCYDTREPLKEMRYSLLMASEILNLFLTLEYHTDLFENKRR